MESHLRQIIIVRKLRACVIVQVHRIVIYDWVSTGTESTITIPRVHMVKYSSFASVSTSPLELYRLLECDRDPYYLCKTADTYIKINVGYSIISCVLQSSFPTTITFINCDINCLSVIFSRLSYSTIGCIRSIDARFTQTARSFGCGAADWRVKPACANDV